MTNWAQKPARTRASVLVLEFVLRLFGFELCHHQCAYHEHNHHQLFCFRKSGSYCNLQFLRFQNIIHWGQQTLVKSPRFLVRWSISAQSEAWSNGGELNISHKEPPTAAGWGLSPLSPRDASGGNPRTSLVALWKSVTADQLPGWPIPTTLKVLTERNAAKKAKFWGGLLRT